MVGHAELTIMTHLKVKWHKSNTYHGPALASLDTYLQVYMPELLNSVCKPYYVKITSLLFATFLPMNITCSTFPTKRN